MPDDRVPRRYRAIVEVEIPESAAPSEEEVDDIIHAAVDLGGELPPDSTVFTMEVTTVKDAARTDR